MGKLVKPKVFLVGATDIMMDQVLAYLKYTGQEDFYQDIVQASKEGISTAESLCSLYAKLCYKSLVRGKNANVTRTRDIGKNLEGCFDQGHGSVFEHFQLNFVVTDCSRVFTHELVRHRVGTAFSQTSGRFCRLDEIDLVWDPILDPVEFPMRVALQTVEMAIYTSECMLGLRKPNPDNPLAGVEEYERRVRAGVPWQDCLAVKWVPDDTFDMAKRKKITSALRRIAPNGQGNEIGFSVNVRALRQLVQLRTNRHAEYEIRNVFGQIYHEVATRYPLMFYKARTRIVDEMIEVYGMKCQPWEIEPGDPKALEYWSSESLAAEMFRRRGGEFSE